MIYQKDKATGKQLSVDMTLDQAKSLPVIDYIDLECTDDATKDEKDYVKLYRIKNEIGLDEIVSVVSGNEPSDDLKKKVDEIMAASATKEKEAAAKSSKASSKK